jgi:hypothetical protein
MSLATQLWQETAPWNIDEPVDGLVPSDADGDVDTELDSDVMTALPSSTRSTAHA